MGAGTTHSPPTGAPEPSAGRYVHPWEIDALIPPPRRERRRVLSMLGPGLLLAGGAIGAGEWLFGPAVSARYGGTLLWLATISIVVQVFYNLEVMRYALYCGEPIFIGFLRTRPGPRLWVLVYMTLLLAHVWPYMASNAAVPLAAAVLGHLPGDAVVSFAGHEMTEGTIVKVLGFVIFYLAFVPLLFGGKIYTMLERVMTIKLVIVLAFLILVCSSMVSPRNAWEVVSGFVRFGTVPLRADTVIAGRHFTLSERDGSTKYTLEGTVEDGVPAVTAFLVERDGVKEPDALAEPLSPELSRRRKALVARAAELAKPGDFYVQTTHDDALLTVTGRIAENGKWLPAGASVRTPQGTTDYQDVTDVPEVYRAPLESLVANQGFQREQLWDYWREHGQFPPLDWAMLAAFAAIAGAGGLSNALLSNYARDKGWAMGDKTGAIPSAIGGRTITLSHVGKTFPVTPQNLARWRAWYRYIVRDQVGMWMVCSFIGMALPCMLSLQFIRNAPVSGNRVAALTAEGIASQFPSYAQFWWSITLVVSFLALAPNAVMSGDLIARLWTDIVWVGSKWAHRFQGNQVRYIYYAVLAGYGVWGSAALAWLNPLQIAKLGAVLGNIALGFSSFHTLYVNRTLLPPELRPNWFMQAGLAAAGVFFLSITAVAIWYS
ncbi:MAG: Nramp family divalent metal transporter [Planctomycetia bacterium]|nr:Nramp family divalent metal transporter [Planctomycetia bacterium]